MNRRRLLRGALAGIPVAFGLPRLEAMLNNHGDAFADNTPLPTRMGVWFFGTGVHEKWAPASTGALVLPNGFTALQRHLPRVSMISGLQFESFGDYSTNRHYMGASSVLSGTPPSGEKVGGITIDQAVAKQWPGTPRASIEISVSDDGAISFNGANSPNPPIRDPRILMSKLFGGPAPAPGTTAPVAVSYRQSYLDAVGQDIKDLQKRLGAHDRMRLDSYLEGISELQKTNMVAITAPAATCTPAASVTSGISNGTLSSDSGFAAINKANSQLLAIALGCGLTRTFTFSLSCFNSTPWIQTGLANNHHELGHQQHPDLVKSVSTIMERFADTLDALAGFAEGAGNVLDRTGIIVLTETAWNHVESNLPIILAGGSATKLKGGQHIRSSGASTRASLTLAQAVGSPLASFGAQGAAVNAGKVITDALV